LTLNEIWALRHNTRVAYIGPDHFAWSGRVKLLRPNYTPWAERTANKALVKMTDFPEDWELIDERI